MNDLQIFKNQNFGKVRCFMYDNIPYFVAFDVAKILGYTNPKISISQHCEDVSNCFIYHPKSTKQLLNVTIIKDKDLYKLIKNSKMENSNQFYVWICEEVIPSLKNLMDKNNLKNYFKIDKYYKNGDKIVHVLCKTNTFLYGCCFLAEDIYDNYICVGTYDNVAIGWKEIRKEDFLFYKKTRN